MNLLLLHPSDFVDSQRARLDGRRLQHLREIHASEAGDRVRVGQVGGLLGSARIAALDQHHALLEDLQLDTPPPPPLPLILVVALPRPKMLRRILQSCATMGVKQLILLHSYRVEKSYWQTPVLQPQNLRHWLELGLEQGVDTVLPQVHLERRFKPFVEDRLPGLCRGRRALVAHPRASLPCPPASNEPGLLVIGPEGGFIDYEVDKLTAAGCQAFHLGPRILRVETAVTALLARLFPLPGC